jgi:pyruvate/2-oxoglutarate dehydrogenase complex dihydrolipoamide acyltransferase (E2) component
MAKTSASYKVVPFPKMRRLVIDSGWIGSRKNIIHGLIEVDVTKARQYLREYKARTGESLSFTAFIITCLGQAVETNNTVHAYRNWRNQFIIFDDVDVTTIIESEINGQVFPFTYVIRATNKRSFRDIHEEIRAIQVGPGNGVGSKSKRRYWATFLSLPTFIRHLVYRIGTKSPHLWKRAGGTVVVTSVGMFTKGSGWGISNSGYTLSITLGGIAEKPGVVDGQITIREYLSMTISFDHDVVDGAPAARFTHRLKELIERGYDLSD